jgi:hypothetical protein
MQQKNWKKCKVIHSDYYLTCKPPLTAYPFFKSDTVTTISKEPTADHSFLQNASMDQHFQASIKLQYIKEENVLNLGLGYWLKTFSSFNSSCCTLLLKTRLSSK